METCINYCIYSKEQLVQRELWLETGVSSSVSTWLMQLVVAFDSCQATAVFVLEKAEAQFFLEARVRVFWTAWIA